VGWSEVIFDFGFEGREFLTEANQENEGTLEPNETGDLIFGRAREEGDEANQNGPDRKKIYIYFSRTASNLVELTQTDSNWRGLLV
jgi:hypothetical protein